MVRAAVTDRITKKRGIKMERIVKGGKEYYKNAGNVTKIGVDRECSRKIIGFIGFMSEGKKILNGKTAKLGMSFSGYIYARTGV